MYGEKLKQLRKEKKISQKELAELSGLSISYIQQIESGKKNNPSLEALTAIAKVLDTPMYHLLDDSMKEYKDEFYFKQCIDWLRPILIDEPEYASEEAQRIYGYTLTILETLEHAYNNPNIREEYYYDVVNFLQYLSYRYGFDPATGVGIVPPIDSKEEE